MKEKKEKRDSMKKDNVLMIVVLLILSFGIINIMSIFLVASHFEELGFIKGEVKGQKDAWSGTYHTWQQKRTDGTVVWKTDHIKPLTRPAQQPEY